MCRTRLPLSITAEVGTDTRFHMTTGRFSVARAAVSASPNVKNQNRIESKGEFHPPALIVAWRARLVAPRFTVLAVLANRYGVSTPARQIVFGLAAQKTKVIFQAANPVQQGFNLPRVF